MRMQIPQDAAFIIQRLRRNGYEAYVVGGCVRDTLLGRTPEDWDITTSAKPQEVKALFRRTLDTGIQHGTVTILLNHVGYEVTTYRVDGKYEDGRHPKQVTFTASLLEDLKRRDFTINAMAYSPQTGLVDEFDGVGDLKRGVIRCVGDPMERFTEDALRILRAIRFSAQLGFSIEDETRGAIRAIAPNIEKVSRERIQAELTKLLLSAHPEQMHEVFAAGIHIFISPAFAKLSDPWEEKASGDAGCPVRVSALPAVRYLRWAAFLRNAGEEQAVRVLKELRLDKDTTGKARTLVSWSGRDLYAEAEKISAEEFPAHIPEEEARTERIQENALEITVRRAMSRMTPELWDALLLFNAYDAKIRALTETIRARGDCLDLRHLAVGGKDLLDAGLSSGKEIGGILESMLDQVLLVPEHNTRAWLLQWAGCRPI